MSTRGPSVQTIIEMEARPRPTIRGGTGSCSDPNRRYFSSLDPVQSDRGIRISTRRFFDRPSAVVLEQRAFPAPLPSTWTRSGRFKPFFRSSPTAFRALDRKMPVGREADALDRLIVGMSDHLDEPALLIEQFRDARGGRLECLAHVRLAGIEQGKTAEPDDDHARRLGDGDAFVGKLALDARKLRGRRRRVAGEAAAARTTRRAISILSLGCSVVIAPARGFGASAQQREQGRVKGKQQRADDRCDDPDRHPQPRQPAGELLPLPVRREIVDGLRTDAPQRLVEIALDSAAATTGRSASERCTPWKPSARHVCCSSSSG